MSAVDKYNLTLNDEKCSFGLDKINLLWYTISKGFMAPDADRLKPLLQMPVPHNQPSLRRAMGMFAHYTQWIASFSEKIHPLTQVETFPLSRQAVEAFEGLKKDIAKSAITTIDQNIPLVVEADASDCAIAASLGQADRPVAFFRRTLSQAERRHPAIEKEAYAIVEALRKWRHYLIGCQFKLITDQKSVAFMFNSKTTSKTKNEKIARWRIELSCFSFDVSYRPGKENLTADTLSRVCCTASSGDELRTLHNNLCHPDITRMVHAVRCRNLPLGFFYLL